MQLSAEAKQVSQDILEAMEVYKERALSVNAPEFLGTILQVAGLIGEERRGNKSGSPRVNTGMDPVSVARRSPKVPFVPTSSVEAAPRRSSRKVQTPVAPKAKAAAAEPKARKRSSRRSRRS